MYFTKIISIKKQLIENISAIGHTLRYKLNPRVYRITRDLIQLTPPRGKLRARAFFLSDRPVAKAGHERKRRSGAIGTRFNGDLISWLGHVFSWKRPEGAHARWETVCLSRAKRVSGTPRARHGSSWGVRVPR